jgi:alanyl-tRNA synthetase
LEAKKEATEENEGEAMISKKEWEKLKKKEKILKEAAKILRVEEKDLPRVIERFKKEIKEMEEKL